jgi:uncharacterized protein YegJ (DUF2314 family)
VKGKLICVFIPLLTLLIPSLALRVEAANVVGQKTTKADMGPTYFQVPSDHAAMHQAVTEARRTVSKFIAALKHPRAGEQDFEVKKPFIQGNQVEHMWLADVQFVGNRFQGRIDNEPRKIHGPKMGQLVSVDPNEISDWMYIDQGRLIGGYTIRARYNQLSPAQKQRFDSSADFKISGR